MQNVPGAGPSNSVAERGGLNLHGFHDLPSLALETLFLSLNPRDRARASIVCKSWAETYEFPSLWKTPVFSFSKGYRERPCFNPRSVVRRFGKYFQKVTILCRNTRRGGRVHKFAHEQISDFFNIMVQENVQIESFRMPRLNVLSKYNHINQLMLCVPFVDFLKMQSGLATVDFNYGNSHAGKCMEILESLVAENVQHLKLQRFFYYGGEISMPPLSIRFRQAITRFHGLRSLWLNYQYVTNDVMSTLAINLEGHMDVFGLLVENVHGIWIIISDNSWIALKTKCPKMRVHFRLETNYAVEIIRVIESRIMSAEMPLSSVEYIRVGYTWFARSDIAVFDFLKENFADTLSEAKFLLKGEDNLSTCASSLLSNCHKLETLIMRIVNPPFKIPQFFDDILNNLQEINREMISLKVFRVTFRKMYPKMKRSDRIPLLVKYVPRFKEFGIELKLKIKKK